MKNNHKQCLALWMACLLAAFPCQAQCTGGGCRQEYVRQPTPFVQPSEPHPAVCRIRNSRRQTIDIGSGTLIGRNENQGLVLTCAHLFEEGKGTIVVEFPGRRSYQARLIAIDRKHDLAALLIRRPSIVPIRVALSSPSGTLLACGYGSDGRFACARGTIAGYATPEGASFPSIKIRGAVRSGDSGGVVLNLRNQLVGVIWGAREGFTYATQGEPLRQFLARVRGQPTSRPQVVLSPVKPKPSPFNRRLAAMEQRVESLTIEIGGTLRHENLLELESEYATKRQLDQLDQKTVSRHDGLLSRLKMLSTKGTNEKKDRVAPAGLFEGLSTGKLIAGALGIGGPIGLAIVLGSALAGRRFKRRFRRRGLGGPRDRIFPRLF